MGILYMPVYSGISDQASDLPDVPIVASEGAVRPMFRG
jgi:hypothetical protein